MAQPSAVAQKDAADTNHHLPIDVATLEPATEATWKTFDETFKCLNGLHSSLQDNIYAESITPSDRPFKSGEKLSDGNSEAPNMGTKYKGYFKVTLRPDKNGNVSLGWTVGCGDPELGPIQGISHMISCSQSNARGVVAQLARIQIDYKTGQIYLEGLSNTDPVIVICGGERKVLYRYDKCLILRISTQVIFGNDEYIFAIKNMNDAERAKYVELRDFGLSKIGKMIPDRRLEPLPTAASVKYIGDVVLHQFVDWKGLGEVWTGINTHTTKPCIIKTKVVEDVECRDKIIVGLFNALKYPNHAELSLVLDVWDDYGNCLTPSLRQIAAAKGIFATYSFPCTIHIVMPLPMTDFRTWGRGKPSVQQLREVFRGPLQALELLHADGYRHGNVTPLNMFVESTENALLGRLANFGDPRQEENPPCIKMGSSATCAPEIDGVTQYTQSSDIFAIGIAILKMHYPKVLSWPSYNECGIQSKEWLIAVHTMLVAVWEGQLPQCDKDLACDILKMTSSYPAARPSATQFLEVWPKPIRAQSPIFSALNPNDVPLDVPNTAGDVLSSKSAATPSIVPQKRPSNSLGKAAVQPGGAKVAKIGNGTTIGGKPVASKAKAASKQSVSDLTVTNRARRSIAAQTEVPFEEPWWVTEMMAEYWANLGQPAPS